MSKEELEQQVKGGEYEIELARARGYGYVEGIKMKWNAKLLLHFLETEEMLISFNPSLDTDKGYK